jgi:thiamine-phosphate pyrophosphorylase
MKTIVISYPEEYKDEHIIINELFRNGLEIFHLRKPLYSADKIISLLDMIDAKYHKRIVLHSHYHLSENLKGIHFTGKTTHLIDKYKDVPCHKSISCHSIEEINEYSPCMDYCFISPVFDSISKKDYKANIDLIDLQKCNNINKTVALGGISSSNISALKGINLYGFALLGYIWNNENIIRAFKEIQKCI